VTADYGLLDDGSGISVLNAQNMWKVTGNISTIEGRAFAPNASEPGQLQVEFDAVPFPGSYWIVKLGLVENGQYQYSVVTDSNGFTLFILVRALARSVFCVYACARHAAACLNLYFESHLCMMCV